MLLPRLDDDAAQHVRFLTRFYVMQLDSVFAFSVMKRLAVDVSAFALLKLQDTTRFA